LKPGENSNHNSYLTHAWVIKRTNTNIKIENEKEQITSNNEELTSSNELKEDDIFISLFVPHRLLDKHILTIKEKNGVNEKSRKDIIFD
jgi:hypothetical protein